MTTPRAAHTRYTVLRNPAFKKGEYRALDLLNAGTKGPVQQLDIDPIYMDIILVQNGVFKQQLSPSANAFVYLINSILDIDGTSVNQGHLAILNDGDQISIRSKAEDTRVLLVAGEPVAKGGPFIMNAQAELRQAFYDYQTGQFIEA